MSLPKFPRGSEWRRWDLQVHTPFSALNNGFGSNFEEYARALFLKAITNKIAAIGVTDYFSLEGYTRLRALLANPDELGRLVGVDLVDQVTFLGLRQLLNEPEDRVFIGVLPPSLERIAIRPTRVVRSVEIRRVLGSSSFSEKWFDYFVPLNPELVAVIGNKGNGKSALADVLGLLGNTPRHGSFSFLNEERFRDPRNRKARHFQASLTWADGTTEGPLALDQDPDRDAPEKIRYIPQNYLEEICNEVGLGTESRFYRELQQVIFSHVPSSERLGFDSLDALLEHRGAEIDQAIEILAGQLREINREIVSCEERLTARHRKALELQLAEKRRELDAHNQMQPAEVSGPGSGAMVGQKSQETSQLENRQGELRELEEAISERGSVPMLVEKRNGAFFRLVKCTTSRPPWQAATGGTRHERGYQEAGRSA